MPFKEPIAYKKVGDVVLSNFSQELELQARIVDDKPNPLFTKYRNASSRVWLKNGKAYRVLIEIDGVIDKTNPLATGTTSCKALEYQPIFVRVRKEEPSMNIPTDPALDVIEASL